VKSNKSISGIFFDQIPFFAISKMAKNEFQDKMFLIYLISRGFLPGLKISGPL